MNCPICKTTQLVPTSLENGPGAFRCENCSGTFISSTDYWPWLKTQQPDSTKISISETPAQVIEAALAKVCPQCGHLMRRYKIWPEVEFYLDTCNHCNGIWLDKNEWQVLESHHQQGKINLFFTQPWQSQLHAEETRQHLAAIYQTRFGVEDYTRLKEIKAWIDQHKERGAMLPYLEAEDPYK